MVPLDVADSSLPVAIFQYRLRGRGPKPVDVSLAFSLLNAVGYDGKARLSSERDDAFGGNLNQLREEATEKGRVLGSR